MADGREGVLERERKKDDDEVDTNTMPGHNNI
jgi:hypothetical protein